MTAKKNAPLGMLGTLLKQYLATDPTEGLQSKQRDKAGLAGSLAKAAIYTAQRAQRTVENMSIISAHMAALSADLNKIDPVPDTKATAQANRARKAGERKAQERINLVPPLMPKSTRGTYDEIMAEEFDK